MSKHTLFDIEEWRASPGWEGLYEVSSHGRVRSLPRKIPRADSTFSQLKGGLRKQSLSEFGYRTVSYTKNRKSQCKFVHHLVLEAFVGPRPEGMETRHLDGNRTNNHISNLRWGTSKENSQDISRHGTGHWAGKTHCPRGHELKEPNLVWSKLAINRRGCIACARARSYIRDHPELVEHFQKISDQYYESLGVGK